MELDKLAVEARNFIIIRLRAEMIKHAQLSDTSDTLPAGELSAFYRIVPTEAVFCSDLFGPYYCKNFALHKRFMEESFRAECIYFIDTADKEKEVYLKSSLERMKAIGEEFEKKGQETKQYSTIVEENRIRLSAMVQYWKGEIEDDGLNKQLESTGYRVR